MKPEIYNLAKKSKNIIDLLDNTSVSPFDNSAIYNILRENIETYPELIPDANNNYI